PVQLGASGTGGPTLDSLTLSAQSLVNQVPGGNSSFAAKTITLTGLAAPTSPTAGSGTATFSGDEIDLGWGPMPISGFGNTRLTASKAFVAKGDGGLTVSGDLGTSAPVLTATSYADVDHPDSTPKASLAQISAGGTLTIAKPANATRPTLTAAY